MHENSACCGAIVWRFGKRRRRCSKCRRTWRSWVKIRGRKRLGRDEELLDKVLIEKRSLTDLAREQRLSRQAVSYRFRQALRKRLERAPAPPVQGDLLLIADGLWFRFKRRPWVLYMMALRPVQGSTATFVDPFILRGRETRFGWERALDTLPGDSRSRIRALVVDNFGGCTTIAKKNGWVLQLCHFHLLAQLRSRIGIRRPSVVSAREIRLEGYNQIRIALVADEDRAQIAISRLIHLAGDPATPWRYAHILREFIRRVEAYRAFKINPELLLPNTTGSAESMGRRVRDLLRRTRSIRTPESLMLWVKNYVRARPTITCNPGRDYTK